MEEKSKSSITKWILIGAVGIVLIAAAIIFFVFIKGGKDAYRIIKVYEVKGKATIERDGKGSLDVYDNMVLQSGDEVHVEQGTLTLKLDDDKYVYAEESTDFELVATGSSENSKTTINLKKGAITNEIQNKLSNDSTYEINTQNSNMSVRGTIYRVAVYEDEEGVSYTKVSVFDGQVATKLIDKDGNVVNEAEVLIAYGKEVVVYEDEVTTDYYMEPREIVYEELPPQALNFLIEIAENNSDVKLDITIEELKEIVKKAEEEVNPGPFTVTFEYNGTTFGTQTVEREGFATEPSLLPSPSGHWDFDFTTPIVEDVVIQWK